MQEKVEPSLEQAPGVYKIAKQKQKRLRNNISPGHVRTLILLVKPLRDSLIIFGFTEEECDTLGYERNQVYQEPTRKQEVK